jgi:hypothetical protein
MMGLHSFRSTEKRVLKMILHGIYGLVVEIPMPGTDASELANT